MPNPLAKPPVDLKQPVADGDLYDIVWAIQHGNQHATWLFTEHVKIQAIIRARVASYRKMFTWLPNEDFEDVICGLRPRLIELAYVFELPELRNEGRIVSYFNMRIKGEADFLLKKITGMRQIVDDKGHMYLQSYQVALDGLEDTVQTVEAVDDTVIGEIEDTRQRQFIDDIVGQIPKESNDLLWLYCYILKLRGFTWDDVAKKVGYEHSDYVWLKDNTLRYASRLKHRMILMGQQVHCRILAIHTTPTDVGICVLDTTNPASVTLWSKSYETYEGLAKFEAKLGDLYRASDITYVVMNEEFIESRAHVIALRYLSIRESYVELMDERYISTHLDSICALSHLSITDDSQMWAYSMAKIKHGALQLLSDRKEAK